MAKYFGNWKSRDDIANEYGWKASDIPQDVNIVYASYDTPDYEGYAKVIFKKDGKLYEVHDSHCSCNGLENWNPEKTTAEAIRMRGDEVINECLTEAGL